MAPPPKLISIKIIKNIISMTNELKEEGDDYLDPINPPAMIILERNNYSSAPSVLLASKGVRYVGAAVTHYGCFTVTAVVNAYVRDLRRTTQDDLRSVSCLRRFV